MRRAALIAASLCAAIAVALTALPPSPHDGAPRQCLDPKADSQGTHPGMVWVPGGAYRMGDDVYPEEGPALPVKVGGFWMDRHAVSNRQFAAFVKATGYVTEAERGVRAPDTAPEAKQPGAMVFVQPHEVANMTDISQWWHYIRGANWRHPAGPDSSIDGHENYPVVEVTRADALAYAQWAHRALPSEAEMEWAARGADAGAKPSHGQPDEANTWHGVFPVQNSGEDGFVGLAPSGCYKANRLGLYDLIGNVWEWTDTPYTPDHNEAAGYTPSPDEMPRMMGMGTSEYTIKGGSYLCAPNYCMRYRSGARQGQEADLAASHLGFRTILRAPGPS